MMNQMHHKLKNECIFHILPRSDWESAQAVGVYEPESLVSEGFIHCSLIEQVIQVANTFYPGQIDLLLLRIDLDKLAHEVRYEDTLGEGECFPHIYGALNLSAVLAVCPFEPDHDGKFNMPEDTAWQTLEASM